MTVEEFKSLSKEEKLEYYQNELIPRIKWDFNETGNLFAENLEYLAPNGVWSVTKQLTNTYNYLHRIKPEPEYVLFTYKDRALFMGKEVKPKISEKSYIVIACDIDSLLIGINWIDYDYAFENYVFADGTPFGKIKES